MRSARKPRTLHIAAVAEMPLGSEAAHAINTFKTAGGFTRLGHRVSLFCLPPTSSDIASALASYSEPDLEVHTIAREPAPTEDESARLFAHRAAHLAADRGCDCIYGRNFYIAFEGPRIGLPTAIETHAHLGDPRPLLDAVFAATRDPAHPLDAIVTIAPILRDHYIARGADPARVHLVPDGADPDLFAPPTSHHPATPRSRPRILYSGHLYDYKGIPTILKAGALAPDIDWVLLGGTDADIERVRTQARATPNITILGRVPHIAVPAHLWDADVLALPPSAHHPSAHWTSPVKLAEYLWAGTPIAASRIPGLENWVAEPAVAWCTPDDPSALVHCVRTLLAESPHARAARQSAQRAAAQRFTYAARAATILGALGFSVGSEVSTPTASAHR
jgi:glycosyltransferase involved in cell wall biosynthesis